MTRRLGAFGESWATGFLTRQGYQILDRNVRFRVGEIDIVARDGAELVFVEVKSRRSRAFGSPEDSITPRRFERLAAAIGTYLSAHDFEQCEYRVDVVALEVGADGRVARCDLLKAVECPAR